MTPVVGFGAGGHARVVIEILRSTREYEIIGLLETRKELWGTRVLEVKVLGDDSLMSELKSRGIEHAFIGVGTVGDAGPRRDRTLLGHRPRPRLRRRLAVPPPRPARDHHGGRVHPLR